MELSTTYMGLELRNPLVASPSPLAYTVDGVQRLADAGVGAVVLPSLFEEQVREEEALNERLAEAGTESFAESLSYFPQAAEEDHGPRRHLSLVERAAAAVDIPVIASLNGITPGGWTDYARAMQDAGAAAIELNIYYVPGDTAHAGPRRRAAVSRRLGDGQGRGHGAGGGQAQPVFQFARRTGTPSRQGRRGRARAVQPLPAARHRSGESRGRAEGRTLEPGRCRAPADMDRAAARTGAAPRSPPPPVSRARWTSSSSCSPARTW